MNTFKYYDCPRECHWHYENRELIVKIAWKCLHNSFFVVMRVQAYILLHTRKPSVSPPPERKFFVPGQASPGRHLFCYPLEHNGIFWRWVGYFGYEPSFLTFTRFELDSCFKIMLNMSEKKMQDFLISRTVIPVLNAYKNHRLLQKNLLR